MSQYADGYRKGLDDAAALAAFHRGSAAAARLRKGFRITDEIQAEERGEDIAAEIIARNILTLKDSIAKP